MFSMSHGHGLVQQALNIDAVALATLQPRAALIINTQFSAPTQSFLMRRLRYFVQLVGRTAADDGPILIGCAHGDAIVAEIAAAMVERNVNGQEDITSMMDQVTTWAVYQNTVRPVVYRAALTEGQVDDEWIPFGGKNGIPAIEGSGMTIFVYNAGAAALTTGSSINGQAMVQGVWLRD